MLRVRLVMPPDGEEWGFPKPVPSFTTKNEFNKWMVLQGYPEHLIDQLKYSKFYEEEM